MIDFTDSNPYTPIEVAPQDQAAMPQTLGPEKELLMKDFTDNLLIIGFLLILVFGWAIFFSFLAARIFHRPPVWAVGAFIFGMIFGFLGYVVYSRSLSGYFDWSWTQRDYILQRIHFAFVFAPIAFTLTWWTYLRVHARSEVAQPAQTPKT